MRHFYGNPSSHCHCYTTGVQGPRFPAVGDNSGCAYAGGPASLAAVGRQWLSSHALAITGVCVIVSLACDQRQVVSSKTVAQLIWRGLKRPPKAGITSIREDVHSAASSDRSHHDQSKRACLPMKPPPDPIVFRPNPSGPASDLDFELPRSLRFECCDDTGILWLARPADPRLTCGKAHR